MRCLLISLSFLICSVLAAQTPEQIKRDGSYIWAEGFGDDADNQAIAALSLKISTSVRFSCTKDESQRLMKTYKTDVKNASKAVITPLSVLRYINKSDLDKVFEPRKRKTAELIQYADNIRNKDKGLALCYYTWAEVYFRSLPVAFQSQLNNTLSKIASIKEDKSVIPKSPKIKMPHIENEVKVISSILGLNSDSELSASSSSSSSSPGSQVLSASVSRQSKQTEKSIGQALNSPAADTGSKSTDVARGLRTLELPEIPVTQLTHSSKADFPFIDNLGTAAVAESNAEHSKPAARKFEDKTFTFLAAASFNSTLLFGGFVGWQPFEFGKASKFGVYLSFRSDYEFYQSDFDISSIEAVSNGAFWGTGRRRDQTMIVSAGPLISVPGLRWCDFYAGVGYGGFTEYWEDFKGAWGRVTDKSSSGFVSEAGLVVGVPLSRKISLAFSIGVSSIGFGASSFINYGVGIQF